jgi:hypothetical protein
VACQIETVSYPAWWEGATNVRVRDFGTTAIYNGPKEDVELLPEGVSFPDRLTPWWNIQLIEKVS